VNPAATYQDRSSARSKPRRAGARQRARALRRTDCPVGARVASEAGGTDRRGASSADLARQGWPDVALLTVVSAMDRRVGGRRLAPMPGAMAGRGPSGGQGRSSNRGTQVTLGAPPTPPTGPTGFCTGPRVGQGPTSSLRCGRSTLTNTSGPEPPAHKALSPGPSHR
jgi:hypothetical protein